VAGFDGEDGSWARDERRICQGQARNHVDDCADAGGGNDVGESEELGSIVDGEVVFAGCEGGLVEVLEDVLRRLDMNDFLSLDFRDDVDGEIKVSFLVPQICQIPQTLFKKGRFQVLEEVHTLKVRNC